MYPASPQWSLHQFLMIQASLVYPTITIAWFTVFDEHASSLYTPELKGKTQSLILIASSWVEWEFNLLIELECARIRVDGSCNRSNFSDGNLKSFLVSRRKNCPRGYVTTYLISVEFTLGILKKTQRVRAIYMQKVRENRLSGFKGVNARGLPVFRRWSHLSSQHGLDRNTSWLYRARVFWKQQTCSRDAESFSAIVQHSA